MLLSLGSELQSRCRKTEHELLGEWIAEVKNELTSSEAGMCTKGKLMEISQEGLLIVNYSSRLVQLLREVRQLTELGVTVPDSIKQAAKDGEQYYRFGVVLKKVASFFNSMDTQILKTQRPMLLNALMAFEEIVEKRNTHGGVCLLYTSPSPRD